MSENRVRVRIGRVLEAAGEGTVGALVVLAMVFATLLLAFGVSLLR